MKPLWKSSLLIALCLAWLGAGALAASGPFDGRHFKGRIAWSADGNFNDEDDWAASPVALAIFAACGLQGELVHFDYNCILPKTDPVWEKEHAASVLGAARRYGYRETSFHDCQKDLQGAVESIRRAVNASSADDPLYFVLAGPMEVPALGIAQSDPAKRRFVTCISHNSWNDGYASGDLVKHNKRDVIPLGVKWVQIRDQNPLLITSPFGRPARPEEWLPWDWMKDSKDPNVRFLMDRMRASTRADCSDAGMAYFLVSGDERGDIAKLKILLDEKKIPKPIDPRRTIRLEAENFHGLEGGEVIFSRDRKISQRLHVSFKGAGSARMRTTFDEPYTEPRGRYDLEVRYAGGQEGRARFRLLVKGRPQGPAWEAAGQEWRTHTIAGVSVNDGDEITVEARGGSGEYGRLDYLQLNAANQPSATSAASVPAAGFNRPIAGPLDDPAALPGQVIVAGDRPGYLNYNGGGPVFLSGPDNPEEFLYRGALNPDGTRSGGGQEQLIDRLGRVGVNAFHFLLFRMQRCNFKNEGDDAHCPFVDHDPAKPLNEKVLEQWEGWFDRFEAKGIILHVEFYNDATDVERMGWTLREGGKLHPDEHRFI